MKAFAASILALWLAAVSAAAQQVDKPVEEALSSCVALAESGKASEAAAIAKGVEADFRKRLADSPRSAEPRVALARLLSQCLVPSA